MSQQHITEVAHDKKTWKKSDQLSHVKPVTGIYGGSVRWNLTYFIRFNF